MAALEAFDRVATGTTQSALRTRLRRRIAHAGDTFAAILGDDVGAWVNYVVEARDAIAHALERHTRAEGATDHEIAELLYALYVICILRLAGAPEDVVDAIASSSSVAWAAERLRETIADA